MKINEKNNKTNKNFNINDRNISKDFSEIFDATENVVTGHDFYMTYDERYKLNEKKRTEVVA